MLHREVEEHDREHKLHCTPHNEKTVYTLGIPIDASPKELTDNLAKIQNWALQWKMSFNPDISKKAQEVIFSWKLKKTRLPPLMFNSNKVNQISSQKHLGIVLDETSFEEHLRILSVKN